MNDAIEMGSGALMYLLIIIKFAPAIQNLIR
jgi:hypothetical protein